MILHIAIIELIIGHALILPAVHIIGVFQISTAVSIFIFILIFVVRIHRLLHKHNAVLEVDEFEAVSVCFDSFLPQPV